MRVLITGSTGFIGSAAHRALVDAGHIPIVVKRPGSALGDHDIAVDLTDLDGLRKAASGVDAVIHAAASDNPDFWPVSQAAALAMIEGLPDGGRFVAHGGTIVFGPTTHDPANPTTLNPPPPLAGRAALDQAILDAGNGPVHTHVVFGSLVYGGPGAVIPQAMVGAARASGAVLYVGDGSQIWSTVHVGDFGRLLVAAIATADAASGPIFAADRSISMADFAQEIGAALNLPVRAATDEEAQQSYGMFAAAFGMSQHFSGDVARDTFGWTPMANADALRGAIRSLAEGPTK